MVQYLIILLDDTSVSFCHYGNPNTVRRLMPLDILKEGITYAMKENLNVQFVYPDYELPQEYLEAMDAIDHIDIKPLQTAKADDVAVANRLEDADKIAASHWQTLVVRVRKTELLKSGDAIAAMVRSADRLNVVITDVETFNDDDIDAYKSALEQIAEETEALYVKGKSPQVNLLTDRMMLDDMNNCGAGDNNITLAPDGKFYVCPAFYLAADEDDFGIGKDKVSIGNLDDGLDIKNPQLYKLDHAPLCRHCDAYQCRRCVWLNRKMTYEVNTPSHEQCVMAHVERNASRELLLAIRKHGTFLPDREEIKKIDYVDPFDVRKEW